MAMTPEELKEFNEYKTKAEKLEQDNATKDTELAKYKNIEQIDTITNKHGLNADGKKILNSLGITDPTKVEKFVTENKESMKYLFTNTGNEGNSTHIPPNGSGQVNPGQVSGLGNKGEEQSKKLDVNDPKWLSEGFVETKKK